MRTPPMKFESKKAITSFIDEVLKTNGLDNRDHLARTLGITSSTLYGYISRLEIPVRIHQKMLSLQNATGNKVDAGTSDLSTVPLEDLLAEVERRGWKVDLSRILKNQ